MTTDLGKAVPYGNQVYIHTYIHTYEARDTIVTIVLMEKELKLQVATGHTVFVEYNYIHLSFIRQL